MEKQIILQDQIKDATGHTVATMRTILKGDGSTPSVMTVGADNPIGFNDDGTPIFPEVDDSLLKPAQQKMMAQAIQVQKELTKENGGVPSEVNMIGAETETKANPTPQQTVQAAMMKSIASLKMQVAELKKENKDNGN